MFATIEEHYNKVTPKNNIHHDRCTDVNGL